MCSVNRSDKTNAMLEEIEFPVLRFCSPGGAMIVHRTIEDSINLSAAAIQEVRRLDDYRLITKTGAVYKLESVEFKETPSLFWRSLSALIGSRRTASWNFVCIGSWDVNDLRRAILENIERYNEIWQARDLRIIERGLEQATRIEDVFVLFTM